MGGKRLPPIDIMLLLFAAGEIVFARTWGRILAPQWMKPPQRIARESIWIGVGALVVALGDYALLLVGFGSPLSRILP